VFVRFFVEDDELHPIVAAAVRKAFADGSRICFTPQVAREAWTVFTRPSPVGGYGISLSEAAKYVQQARKVFDFAPDTLEVYERWLDLVQEYRVSGRQAHDANHAAAMITHGLDTVLTLDRRDFGRYTEIDVHLLT